MPCEFEAGWSGAIFLLEPPEPTIHSLRVQEVPARVWLRNSLRGDYLVENLMIVVATLAILIGPTLLAPAEDDSAPESCKMWDVW
mgnify:CR=1 FL=1